MDRFIVIPLRVCNAILFRLKSNMDRFIVNVLGTICAYGNV